LNHFGIAGSILYILAVDFYADALGFVKHIAKMQYNILGKTRKNQEFISFIVCGRIKQE
jgi:hypothetical protein